jgi:hypothetical protein
MMMMMMMTSFLGCEPSCEKFDEVKRDVPYVPLITQGTGRYSGFIHRVPKTNRARRHRIIETNFPVSISFSNIKMKHVLRQTQLSYALLI